MAIQAKTIKELRSLADQSVRYIQGQAENDPLTVDIFGEIGGEFWGSYGVNEMRYALTYMAASRPVRVRLHTVGGSVVEAAAIASLLSEHAAGFTTHNAGLVASAGTQIFLAANRRTVAPGSYIMIHNPWSGTVGDAEAHRQQAERLETVEKDYADMYVKALVSAGKMKETEPEIRAKVLQWMASEKLFSASEAVELGFATELTGEVINVEEIMDAGTYAETYASINQKLPTMKNENGGKSREASILEQIKKLFAQGATATEDVADIATEDEGQEDELSKAKKLLEQAGYRVDPAGEASSEDEEEGDESGEEEGTTEDSVETEDTTEAPAGTVVLSADQLTSLITAAMSARPAAGENAGLPSGSDVKKAEAGGRRIPKNKARAAAFEKGAKWLSKRIARG